ncbi:putative lipid II flippase MurJ [Candidatus Hartigia pinicola]|nr:putative lipid II flippase MurJ [Candidatus Hartigia pinicola]
MNLLKSLAAISFMTIMSRVFGFIRDSIIARIFGSGMATDAFFIAFKLPNLLRRIFAEGAFSQVVVPILAEYKNQKGDEATQTLIAYISGSLTLVLALISVFGVIFAPWVIYVTAPGFTYNSDKFILTTELLRITFPYIFLISLASLAGAILNTWNRFLVPAFIPTLLNISMIIFASFAAPYFDPPVISLAWSVIVGGVLQLAYQLPHLKKIGMLVLPRISFHDSRVWYIIKMMGPAIIGVSVSQISLIINTIFASFLQTGSVSWMYYADRLMELPAGVLGVALGTILLPSLAQSFIKGNRTEYYHLMDWGLRLCLLFTLPCAIGLAILAEALTVSLFQYNKFTSYDSVMTQYALISYCIGLTGIILVKILATGFYSCQNTRTPVRIAILTLILTQLMNFAFIGPMKHAGLALSISLAAYFNVSVLYWQLRKEEIFQPLPGWPIFVLKLFIALTIMVLVLFSLLYIIPRWDDGNMTTRLLRLMGVVITGAASYFFTLFSLGFRIKDFKKYII